MASDQRGAAEAPETPAAPAKNYGRAGRNLKAAVLVGVGVALFALAGLYLFHPLFVLLVLVAITLGGRELVDALRAGGINVPAPPLIVGGIVMMLLAWFNGGTAAAAALAFTALAIMAWRLLGPVAGTARDTAGGLFIAVYPFLLGALALLLFRPDDGPQRITLFIAVTVCNDVGGYIAGVWKGKHPMAPTISPKKSWEGFAGSLTACCLAGMILLPWLLGGAIWQGLLFGAALTVASTLGDFAESMIKRDVGIKDMSQLLPGHGGVMDRLDSLAVSLPVAWILLTLMVPPGR